MKFSLPKDYFNNPKPPEAYLCNTSKKIIGQLDVYDLRGTFKWNAYSEISFSVDRTYTDVLTGENKINLLFDKIESPRNIYLKNIGYFTLQDIDTEYADKDTKNISAFSFEYTLGNKYLESFRINTGDIDSKEVLYNENIYGIDYTMNNLYKKATGNFDPYEKYYIQDYTDSDSYTWEQVEIRDEDVYDTYDGGTVAKTLWVKNYKNIQLYNRNNPQLSLLHIVLENTPGWSIGNVDVSLWRQERTFDEERISIYDFFTQKVSDAFKCIFEFDTINSLINVYEEPDDGLIEDNIVPSVFESDVYISRDNLANSVQVSYSSDDIKTKLKVSGADDLSIREANLGKNYLMNLDFYHNLDWMEQDLFDAYGNYLDAVDEYRQPYEDAMQGWVAAYNKWNDLMNAIPVEGNVVLVGDEFKKLYCSYTPLNTAYLNVTLTDSNINGVATDLYIDNEYTQKVDKTNLDDGDVFIVQGYEYVYQESNNNFKCNMNYATSVALPSLTDKLHLYHIDEDIDGTKTDNVLLTLKNSNSDTATIRIYDDKRDENVSRIQRGTPYNPNLQYYTKNNEKYKLAYIMNSNDYQTAWSKLSHGEYLYTNNYKIQCIITRAKTGLKDTPSEYELSDWVQGRLTINKMSDLNGFKIASIGTMGAYFVLAKDEKQEENIADYGVELLREKRDVYTKIFQTQTEAMWSQEKYQCIATKTEPEGNVTAGTRWFKTDEAKLYKRTNKPSSSTFSEKWDIVSSETETAADWENYQRYIDNYEKLQTVQTVLNKKEREANYHLNGYEISDRRINASEFDENTHLDSKGQALLTVMQSAAKQHFNISFDDNTKITSISMDYDIPLYVFTASPNEYAVATEFEPNIIYYSNGNGTIADPQPTLDNFDDNVYYKVISNKTYAVYLNGTTPYVSYLSSRGVYQRKMNYYSNLTEMNKYFTQEQWERFSPFIREDEYSNDNVLLNGLESEEERLSVYKELITLASKELKTLSQPSLGFTTDMTNILAIPEFASISSQFSLGKFIRIELRPGLVKRSRLLEVNLSFENLNDFSCTFGNLVTTKSQIDLHAELLSQAISAGKQVATSAGEWQKAVDKTNSLEQSIANGLQDAAINIGKASGQAISWDSTGMHFRKYKEGSDTEYEQEEMAIINNSLVATNDSWRTSKAAFGKYYVNGEERWGPISEYITSDIIEGKKIIGGSLQIGGGEGQSKFVVNEDGSVQILAADGKSAYATSAIQDAIEFSTRLEYENQTVFSDQSDTCTITCKVYHLNDDITTAVLSQNGSTFNWNGYTGTPTTYSNQPNKITVNHTNISRYAEITCQVQFDDSQWVTNN